MATEKRRIHGGLILASGLLGLSLSVLILGASRGQAQNAGLTGSDAAALTLPDSSNKPTALLGDDTRSLVLLVARKDLPVGGTLATEIRQIAGAFTKGSAVRFVAVQVPTDTGLLDDRTPRPGVFDTTAPGLPTLTDTDGAVARAYRVGDGPVVFVIDDKHVIRGRFPLDRDGTALAVAETVAALRPIDAPTMTFGR